MLSSHNAPVRIKSNTVCVLSFTCLRPTDCGFSFSVTVTGVTLSWTNIQFKRRKYFNCFCTDNPGICCCNVIHWSEQWWHHCPFPHNIHVLWVLLSVRKPLSAKFTFCSVSQVLDLASVSHSMFIFFWEDYNFGILSLFWFMSLCLWCFVLSVQCAGWVLSPSSAGLPRELVASFALTACSGANRSSSRRLHVLVQPMESIWSPTRGYLSPFSSPSQLSCFHPLTNISPQLSVYRYISHKSYCLWHSFTLSWWEPFTALHRCQSHCNRSTDEEKEWTWLAQVEIFYPLHLPWRHVLGRWTTSFWFTAKNYLVWKDLLRARFQANLQVKETVISISVCIFFSSSHTFLLLVKQLSETNMLISDNTIYICAERGITCLSLLCVGGSCWSCCE